MAKRKTPGRGGRRPGAGRPRKIGAFEEAVYLRLPGALVAIYDQERDRTGEPRAELMRRALERGTTAFPAPPANL
jgi:hypothetical protein